jgi:hypothetical protein
MGITIKIEETAVLAVCLTLRGQVKNLTVALPIESAVRARAS